MGQALYRKYRSKSLADIIGQEHITKTLESAIKTNRISHAYLFTGPRGVGKTSIARILAHDINGLEYNNESLHVDIIEIDAASNTGIDDIRDLREKAYIAPTSAKYKVYIIDEVHMLTKQAFNGFLKILEEPPSHVVFILATTESHKVIDTVISRTQHFSFKPVDTKQVVAHLRDIASKEQIKIDDEALQIIAEHGQGSFRDSINLLDQVANFSQPISASSVNNLLGRPSNSVINALVDHLATSNHEELVSSLTNLFDQGFNASIIASQLASKLRQDLVTNSFKIKRPVLIDLLLKLIDVPISPNPNYFLEICLLNSIDIEQASKVNAGSPNKPKAVVNEPIISTTKIEEEPLIEDIKPVDEISPVVDLKTKNIELDWDKVLGLLKADHNTLYGIVRMAKVENDKPGSIKLYFAFAFHQKRVNEARNRDIILNAMKQISGKDFALECIVDKSLLNTIKPTKDNGSIDKISSIFGGGEMMGQ